ncbi:MAG: hypothetical protein F6J93_20555 [Oscillatoria sp. SIO1A7]|nr:hypothetical protein [Oscillatoria sp. SIO1A7]
MPKSCNYCLVALGSSLTNAGNTGAISAGSSSFLNAVVVAIAKQRQRLGPWALDQRSRLDTADFHRHLLKREAITGIGAVLYGWL